MTRPASGNFLPNRNSSARDGLYCEARWYACYTLARHEKRVADLLRQRGIETYLPLVLRHRQWKDRTKIVPWPMLPSYVFGRFALREYHAVLATPGVATVVRSNGDPAPISDGELDNLRRFATLLMDAGVEPAIRPLLRAGQWVIISKGPFRGVQGMVVQLRGRKRVLVGIRAVGQGLQVNVDAHCLRPIARPLDWTSWP